ncbi:MAG: hypothetical protein K1Y01_16585, partial [Vicinamibacteria bacterium]|nr:hypothetical protein [Vicinamibacteria bacterium]
MTLPKASLGPLLVLAILAASAEAQTGKAKGAPAPTPAALELARMGFVEGPVETQHPGGAWTKAAEGQPLLVGDRVRTLKGGTARLEFPWTAIAVGDNSEVTLPNARVLTLQLDHGRIDIDPEQSLLRVITEEAVISGAGRTLVRREGNSTFVASYNGGAEVEAKGKIARLGINKGSLTTTGKAPGEPTTLSAAPHVVSPRADPRYVKPGEAVHLVWTGQEAAYHLEVLAIDSDVPVVSLDIDTREFDLRLPWLGTFRWRVAGRVGPVE